MSGASGILRAPGLLGAGLPFVGLSRDAWVHLTFNVYVDLGAALTVLLAWAAMNRDR